MTDLWYFLLISSPKLLTSDDLLSHSSTAESAFCNLHNSSWTESGEEDFDIWLEELPMTRLGPINSRLTFVIYSRPCQEHLAKNTKAIRQTVLG